MTLHHTTAEVILGGETYYVDVYATGDRYEARVTGRNGEEIDPLAQRLLELYAYHRYLEPDRNEIVAYNRACALAARLRLDEKKP